MFIQQSVSIYLILANFICINAMPHLNKQAWERIGASQTIIDWISSGVPLTFKEEPQPCKFRNIVRSSREANFIQEEINDLLISGAICKVNENETHCVLPIKCVPKKNGKLRLVLDCRHVNEQIQCPKFSQEGIQTVAELIEEGDKIITIDLKNGFHHVKVQPKYHKYLAFQWNGEFYVWQVLAFGIRSAPYFFNKILRPVVSFLRQQGIRNSVFVDDFIVLLRTLCATDHKDFVLQVLEELGWQINVEKSKLERSTSAEFIGYIVYSNGKYGPWIQVTHKKLHKLRRHIRYALSKEKIPAKFLAKIGGECIAMMKAIILAKLLLRNMYRTLASRDSWASDLTLDFHCTKDLQWWLDALKNWNGAPLCRTQQQIQIATDASGSGWGGVCKTRNLEASGVWTKDVSFQPSNFRELLAIYKTLQSFQNDLKGKAVQVLSDNVTAVAYINKMGGSSMIMSDLMKSIFVLTQENDIQLSAKFLAGKLNNHADFLSRIVSPYEWKLHPGVFNQLDMLWGPHTVDRFASEMSTQLPRYNSLYSDPSTEAIDAMTQDWKKENNFINPPFWMLNRIVAKLIREKAAATIIAPTWKAHPWYQKLQQIATTPPLRLKNSPCLMLKLGGIPEPLKNKRWRLSAWRVHGGLISGNTHGQIQQLKDT